MAYKFDITKEISARSKIELIFNVLSTKNYNQMEESVDQLVFDFIPRILMFLLIKHVVLFVPSVGKK